jgi:hypothetical protein
MESALVELILDSSIVIARERRGCQRGEIFMVLSVVISSN